MQNGRPLSISIYNIYYAILSRIYNPILTQHIKHIISYVTYNPILNIGGLSYLVANDFVPGITSDLCKPVATLVIQLEQFIHSTQTLVA